MSRYDGLIIPRSYSEYINKTDAATLQQALQLSGVLSGAVADGDNKAVKSSAVNNALKSNLAKKQTRQHFVIDKEHSAQFTMGNWSCAIIGGMAQGYGGFGQFIINQVEQINISDIGNLHFEISNKTVTVTGSGGRSDLYVLYIGGYGE